MAGWVFKLKGLGADPTIVRTYTVNDAATTRALDKHRKPSESNEQVLVRLWDKFVTDNVVEADHFVRKNEALMATAATIVPAVPVITSTDV